jgi:hypothetical protein
MKFLRIFFAIILYIFILSLFFLFKPSFIFDIKGNIKNIGFSDENKSVLSLYILIPIIILIIYIILSYYGRK